MLWRRVGGGWGVSQGWGQMPDLQAASLALHSNCFRICCVARCAAAEDDYDYDNNNDNNDDDDDDNNYNNNYNKLINIK
jgi:hypothetical protein